MVVSVQHVNYVLREVRRAPTSSQVYQIHEEVSIKTQVKSELLNRECGFCVFLEARNQSLYEVGLDVDISNYGGEGGSNQPLIIQRGAEKEPQDVA